MPPFFYLVGVLISRDWKNPRMGLRLNYTQMDRNIHGCTEDPTDKIAEEITKALQNRDQRYGTASARGFLGTPSYSYWNNRTIPGGNQDDAQTVDDTEATPESTKEENEGANPRPITIPLIIPALQM
jgi:hypothetical protein